VSRNVGIGCLSAVVIPALTSFGCGYKNSPDPKPKNWTKGN
jgi:hypothetical protein